MKGVNIRDSRIKILPAKIPSLVSCVLQADHMNAAAARVEFLGIPSP